MLARKSFLIFVTHVVAGVLGVVSLFFVGRYFEPDPYGMFWFSMGLLGLISALTKLGFEKAHVKRISEGRDLAACVGTFTRIKLVIILLFAVVALTAIFIREITVGWIAATTLPVILVVLVYKVVMKLRSIPKNTFNALRLTATNQSIILVENATRLPLVILVTLAFAFSRGREVPLQGVWIWVTDRLGQIAPMDVGTAAVLYALAYTIPLAVSLFVAVWLFRRHEVPIGGFDREIAKSYWAFAWPVAGYMVFITMTHHIDMVMLGYFWTGTEVGLYKAAFQFVAIVVIIPTAVRTLFFPMISELISKREWTTVKDLALTTQRMMGLVMIPILMLTVVYADDVFRIVMSLTWVPAAPALRLLVVHATLLVLSTVISSMILGVDRARTVMVVALIGVFLNVFLNVIFIPSSVLGVPLFGLQMTGAALASVLSRIVVVAIFIYLGKRIFGVFFFSWSLPKQVLAAALAGGTLWAAEHFIEAIQVVRVWELAIASVVGLALYTGFLFLMRELGRKDVLFFMDLVNPGQMGRYVRDELRKKR